MKLKTTEIPAIIEEAKSAGCENADQINGYLAGEVSRLRGAIACGANALTDSICCSGNDAETNLHWVKKLKGFISG
jgi:hypothetical protein